MIPSTVGASHRWTSMGVTGLLVAAIVALGSAALVMPSSYSWVEFGLSEAAAQGVDGAWVARMGFLLFGFAVLWLIQIRDSSWPPAARVFHLGFAVAMIGVAAFAHKPWEENTTYVASEDLMSSGAWGVLQRIMFLTAACWYGHEAWCTNTATPTRVCLTQTDSRW